jgi:peptide deformylase
MAIKNIVLAGTPQLRHITIPVPQEMFGTADLNTMINNLFETMKACKGVGLAASQIALKYRILVYGFDTNHPRYPDQDPVPLTLMINPEIIAKSNEIIYIYEGCLSIPELRGLVPRYEWIEVKAQDDKGQIFQKRIQGFEARIIQHEIDHLDGKLYPERMDNMRTLGITAALREAGVIR